MRVPDPPWITDALVHGADTEHMKEAGVTLTEDEEQMARKILDLAHGAGDGCQAYEKALGEILDICWQLLEDAGLEVWE